MYQPVYLSSHVPNCSKCTKTYQLWYLVCENSVTSVTVPNVTAVPNVTLAPKVLKMTKNHSSVPKMYQKATCCTYWCSVPTSVPNVTCTKLHQMYQNLPVMISSVWNNVTSVTVPNVTGVPNVTPASKVLKMTKNHSSLPKMYQKATCCTYWCILIGVVYQPVYQTSHVTKCTKYTKTHQGWCLVRITNVTRVTVPNVTGVPNVTTVPIVP